MSSCLNFAADIQAMQKSPAQWQTNMMLFFLTDYWKNNNNLPFAKSSRNCREVLPVHMQSPHTVPQQEGQEQDHSKLNTQFSGFCGFKSEL